MCEEGIAAFRRLGDYPGLAQGLNILGNIHTDRSNHREAKAAYEECLQICYATGEHRREQMMLANLSVVATELGSYAEAYQLSCDAIRLSHRISSSYMTVLELGLSSPAALTAMGHPERAASLLGASEALQEAMNIRQQPNNQLGVERVKARVLAKLSTDTYDALYQEGRKMSLEEAVTLALEDLGI
jgi:tetratricopeptide (TPR) repeat protein